MSSMKTADKQPEDRPDYLQADKVSTTRAMVLFGLGIAVGLVLGGIGLFNARGTTTNVVPPENMALVNQRPILRSDFETQLLDETGFTFEEAPLSEKLRVLDEMLREELMVQRGLELDFAETDQAARYALYDVVEQQSIAEITTRAASDEQLQAYFDAHRGDYMSRAVITVHHLVLDATDAQAGSAAQQIVEALRANTPVADVKQRFGVEEPGFYERDPDYLGKIHLGDELYALASDMDDGQVSDPVLMDGAYHILQMVSNVRPVPRTFEDARSDVETSFIGNEKARLMNNMFGFLRSRATILINEEFAAQYNPEDFLDVYQP